MDLARDDLLAGAALAGDQHRGVGRADLVDELIDLLHRRARADQLAVAPRVGDDLAQPLDLAAQRAMLGGAPDRDRERLDLDRLGDEVVGAGADRADRGLEAAERGQHQHRDVRPISGHALAQLETGDALHVEIGDDDVDVVVRDRGERVGPVGERDDLEAALLEPERDQIDHLALVIDDKDGRHAAPRVRVTLGVAGLASAGRP